MTRIPRLGGIAIAGLLPAIVALSLLSVTSVPNPEFRGKRISTWFDQLCLGVFRGTPAADGFPEAYDAFAQMGPEVVPYLVRQLSIDRSGRKERVMLWLKQQRITSPIMWYAIPPSSRRINAAVALGRMGKSAQAGVPALLEAWKNDIPDVKNNCVGAMAAILYGWSAGQETVGDGSVTEQEFERKVVSGAAERYPDVASALQIAFAAKRQLAEPNGGGNDAKPVSLRKAP